MKRYKLKTPYEVKGSYDLGLLYPIGCLEVIQGQTTRLDTRVLLRAQPLMSPAYEKMNVRVIHAYVPFRTLWDKWDDFIRGAYQGTVPLTLLNLTTDYTKTLVDYLGLPTSFSPGARFEGYNAFPFMAYYKIWNEHFRDPDLQEEVSLALPDNNFFETNFQLKRVNWGKDRFTSALTAAQASPDASVPVNIRSDGLFQLTSDGTRKSPIQRSGGTPGGVWGSLLIDPAQTGTNNLSYASGLSASSISMKDLKAAMHLYNFQINEARFSDDYEGYRAKYGLRPIDARLQKSEIIGGFGDIISISDVLGTGDQNLGEQGGNALAYSRGKRSYEHYAPEHGLILTLMYIRPKATYGQSTDRLYRKINMTDFFQYEFKDLGYQPIQVSEISQVGLINDEVFGYEPRYNEYRHQTSKVVGELKPGKPLSHWASPRVWDIKPVLNGSFVSCVPSTNIWASANTDKFIGYIQHNVSKLSFVPPYSDPKFKL